MSLASYLGSTYFFLIYSRSFLNLKPNFTISINKLYEYCFLMYFLVLAIEIISIFLEHNHLECLNLKKHYKFINAIFFQLSKALMIVLVMDYFIHMIVLIYYSLKVEF